MVVSGRKHDQEDGIITGVTLKQNTHRHPKNQVMAGTYVYGASGCIPVVLPFNLKGILNNRHCTDRKTLLISLVIFQ